MHVDLASARPSRPRHQLASDSIAWMNSLSITVPLLSATRTEMRSASGQIWRMMPAMNVP